MATSIAALTAFVYQSTSKNAMLVNADLHGVWIKLDLRLYSHKCMLWSRGEAIATITFAKWVMQQHKPVYIRHVLK